MSDPTPQLSWAPAAEELLERALAEMPGPKLLAGVVRGRLRSVAEDAARAAGHTFVEPDDLLSGVLGSLPAPLREKVEARLREGPAGIQKLQDELTRLPPQT